MLLNELSRYFQQLLIEFSGKQFEDSIVCHAYLYGLVVQTIQDQKVCRGIRALYICIVKSLLEVSDSSALYRILGGTGSALEPDLRF